MSKMTLGILGISGSPIENSNTDRAVQAVLNATGLDTEFVKLSEISVRPCRACKQCVSDNTCKQMDDFPDLAKKVLKARALVIGAYCPYGMVDGFTKAFLERLWSMRHVKNLNRDKIVVLVVSGLVPDKTRLRGLSKIILKPFLNRYLGVHQVSRSIAREIKMENMNLLGTIKIRGNVPCLVCGHGNYCQMSGAKQLYGNNVEISDDLCVSVEDQPEVWRETERLGKKITSILIQKDKD